MNNVITGFTSNVVKTELMEWQKLQRVLVQIVCNLVGSIIPTAHERVKESRVTPDSIVINSPKQLAMIKKRRDVPFSKLT